jgi:hypothetical protein
MKEKRKVGQGESNPVDADVWSHAHVTVDVRNRDRLVGSLCEKRRKSVGKPSRNKPHVVVRKRRWHTSSGETPFVKPHSPPGHEIKAGCTCTQVGRCKCVSRSWNQEKCRQVAVKKSQQASWCQASLCSASDELRATNALIGQPFERIKSVNNANPNTCAADTSSSSGSGFRHERERRPTSNTKLEPHPMRYTA